MVDTYLEDDFNRLSQLTHINASNFGTRDIDRKRKIRKQG